jgi:tripartite-type tricarboxylate transporter receptor subunit TctC
MRTGGKTFMTALGFITALGFALVLGGGAAAQDAVADFYRGKTVTITVGSAVGGGYDAYARLVARHLGRHIPGNPTIVVQNMPGAGSNRAASFVALQAPKDGTAIGAIQPGGVLWTLLFNQPVQHDPSKLVMIGSANRDVYLCLVRSDAGVKSFQEVLNTKEVIIGTAGEGAAIRDMPVLLVNVLGAKLRLVAGYAGSREILIAMERNEVQGICGMGWASISMQHSDWIKNGFVRILAQEDMKGEPAVSQMGVPLTVAFAKSEEDRQVMELIYSQSLFGRPYMLPPGVPPERVAALRKAFMAALADKELIAEAAKARLELAPMSGEDMQALVARLYALPARISERAKQALIYRAQPK